VHAADDAHTIFCTDGRYLTQSASRSGPGACDRPQQRAVLAARVAKEQYRKTGYESQHVNRRGAGRAVQTPLWGSSWSGRRAWWEALRVVKDDIEIEALRMACAAADRALAT